jgi:hypothetical protein
MTTEDHNEREGATGRRRLRAHARETVDRPLLGVATLRSAEAEHRTAGPRAAGYGAPPAEPAHGANSATKILFCTRDQRRGRHLVGQAGVDTAGVVPFVEGAW